MTLSREDVDKLFKDHHKDGEEKLSWDEFAGVPSKNEKAFKLMDENHDGKITKSVNNIELARISSRAFFSGV